MVHSGLCTLWAQALRVGTCASTPQADELAKHANSIPINNHSLFGEGLRTVVAKAASTARNYADMADGLHKPTPPQGKLNHKRMQASFPTPFHGGNWGWWNRSSSKERKPTTTHDRALRSDHKSFRGSKPAAGQTPQPKGKPRGGRRGCGGKDPKV